MTGFGIHDGDTLVVDRSVEAQDGHIVLAIIGEEFTLKQLRRDGQAFILRAGNPGLSRPHRQVRGRLQRLGRGALVAASP